MDKLLFLSIFLGSAASAAEKTGMPQLDTTFWFSQIFWLIITFSILLVLLSKFILPKISANLETRKSRIQENISAAEKQREESEAKINEYERIIEKSKKEEFKDKAPKKINIIAVETSSDLLQQLIGTDVNSSSISAIVDDLSRKKINKYYGN